MTQLLLHRCWNSLWPDTPPGSAQYVWNMLERVYSEPGRHYHNLWHIHDMVKLLGDCHLHLLGSDEQRRAIMIAAFFHDAVYEPGSQENEEKSAALFASIADELRCESSVREYTRRLILITKHHFNRPDNLGLQEHLFLDVDLEILSATPDRYDSYARGIRAEFSSLSDEVYDTSRLGFLEGVSHNPTIYWTRELGSRGEWDARSNVMTEINQIRERQSRRLHQAFSDDVEEKTRPRMAGGKR